MSRENPEKPSPGSFPNEPQNHIPASPSDSLSASHAGHRRQLPGSPISLFLGGLILVSISLMTLGLLQYEGLSNQAKGVQASWPATAEKLEEMYRKIDQPLSQASTAGQLSPEKLKDWQAGREQFRSLLRWNEQIRAAEELEIRLNDPAIQTALLSQSPANQPSDEFVAARKTAKEQMNQFLCDQMIPYRQKFTKFPGNLITVFMKLPEPEDFVFTQWP